MKRLWAPWRMSYVGAGGGPPAGCVFCAALGAADDRANLVLARAGHAFLILNAYPYAPGHLMAVPNRHVATLAEAEADEVADTLDLVRRAIAILTVEYHADGFNVGWNQGRLAGAGIADHFHVHVVPRWNGDTNFMSVVSDVRVLPEALASTYDRLRARILG